jgi:hypothetical protein
MRAPASAGAFAQISSVQTARGDRPQLASSFNSMPRRHLIVRKDRPEDRGSLCELPVCGFDSRHPIRHPLFALAPHSVKQCSVLFQRLPLCVIDAPLRRYVGFREKAFDKPCAVNNKQMTYIARQGDRPTAQHQEAGIKGHIMSHLRSLAAAAPAGSAMFQPHFAGSPRDGC